jgi:hypothetical protein
MYTRGQQVIDTHGMYKSVMFSGHDADNGMAHLVTFIHSCHLAKWSWLLNRKWMCKKQCSIVHA